MAVGHILLGSYGMRLVSDQTLVVFESFVVAQIFFLERVVVA